MDKIADIIEELFIHPCYTAYDHLAFEAILRNYNQYEVNILNDIAGIISYYFSAQGYNTDKQPYTSGFQRYFVGNRSFLAVREFLQHERRLCIYLKDEQAQCSEHIEKIINGFGAVRSISIFFPRHLEKPVPELAELIRKYIVSAYSALERVVCRKFEHIADKVCTTINSILITHLVQSGKSHLLDSTKFFVFQKQVGFFYFNRDNYNSTVRSYLRNQNDLYSPFELLIWLLTNPLPFGKSLTSRAFFTEGNIASQEWNEADFRDERKFFEAARNLYGLAPYSVLSIHRTSNDDYRLSIAFKKEYKRELIPELKKIRTLIITQFEEAIRANSRIIKDFRIDRLSTEVRSKPEAYGAFAGEFVASFLKTLHHSH